MISRSAFEDLLRAEVEAMHAPARLLLRAERRRFAERALTVGLPTIVQCARHRRSGSSHEVGTDLREKERAGSPFRRSHPKGQACG